MSAGQCRKRTLWQLGVVLGIPCSDCIGNAAAAGARKRQGRSPLRVLPEKRNTGLLGGFAHGFVQRCKGQSFALGKINIGRIVGRKPVADCRRCSVANNGQGVRRLFNVDTEVREGSQKCELVGGCI